jgi:hypothetical protein
MNIYLVDEEHLLRQLQRARKWDLLDEAAATTSILPLAS